MTMFQSSARSARAITIAMLCASAAIGPGAPAVAAVAAAAGAASATTTTLALVGGRIYPAPDVLPIFDGTVIAVDGTITAVGRREEVPVPAGAVTIDCTGLVIVAGFQNSHVHFTEAKWVDAAHSPADELAGELRAMLTRYGYTTVVDTASFLDNTLALRARIGSGEVAGPRILTAGEGLYPPRGVPFYLRETMPAELLPLLPQPRTPAEATAIVERHLAAGADLTKLFTGSWIERGSVLPMPDDVAAAAVRSTHAGGKLVFGHPSNVAGLEVALRAGVDVLAHAVDDTRGFTPAHLERMKAQDVAMVPTLKLFGGNRWLFEVMDTVRDYARLGGQILFGTDVGYLTDYDPTEELVLLQSAGLGWREILAALTTSPAARFGEAARRGRIATGMDADLVVLAKDPVRDVRAFADVRYTVRGGRVIYPAPR